MEAVKNNNIVVFAESTPNPNTLKFVVNKLLVDGGAILEYSNVEQSKGSPLAAKLFQFPFVKNVFITTNFITITKAEEIGWSDVMSELREFIKKYFDDGGVVLTDAPLLEGKEDVVTKNIAPIITGDVDMKIVEILDEYIKPAVEQDGGAITFRHFRDGVVTVALQGACSGCPSSKMTLKAGIEGLLKRMIPEVQTVVAEDN